jgi:glucose-6-phosphate 1-epimerase
MIARAGRRGAFEVVTLTGAGGARAEVCAQRAQVLSWAPAGEARDRLFVAGNEAYRRGEEIWGGIPIVFPQFGHGALPLHGFARTLTWRVREATADHCLLTVQDDPATRALWPHPFHLDLHVRVGGAVLEVGLVVRNTGSSALAFGAGLHTYLAVDAAGATLHGLAGADYQDKNRDFAIFTQHEESLPLSGPVDRVYRDARYQLGVVDGARRLGIAAGGFPDVVVWNPGPGEAGIAAFAPGDAGRMACVEAVLVGPRTLEPGAAFHGTQRLEAG